MSRKNRLAPPGYWLHITPRGNDRQRVFLTDADRQVKSLPYGSPLMASPETTSALRL